MGISQIPLPSTAIDVSTAWSFTATSANVLYESGQDFDPALYLFATSSNLSVYVEFFNQNTRVHGPIQTSGSTQTVLTTSATSVKYWSATTSTNAATMTLTKLASSITTGAFTGATLDVITSSTTFTSHTVGQVAYVVALGGGGGGGYGNWGGGAGGEGGGGANTSGIFTLNTSGYTVTLGAKGTGSATTGGNGNAGGSTTFGNLLTAPGGNAGAAGNGSDGQGSTLGISGFNWMPSAFPNLLWYLQGTTSAVTGFTAATSFPWGNGNGGAGGFHPAGGHAGGGRGIGVGGSSGPNNSNPRRAAYGYAAGGGGGPGYYNSGNQQGTDGSDGVVYVFRWTP